MFICMFIYCLLQLAFILALPPELLQNGWENLSFSGETEPLAGLAIIIGLAWFGIILYLYILRKNFPFLKRPFIIIR